MTIDHRTNFLLQNCSLSSCVLFTITRLKRLLLFNLVIYSPLKIFFILYIFSKSLTLYVLHMPVLLWTTSLKAWMNSWFVFFIIGLFPIVLRKDLLFWGHFDFCIIAETWSLCYRLWFCLQDTYFVLLTFFAQSLNWVDSRKASTSSFLLLGTSHFILLTHQYRNFTW